MALADGMPTFPGDPAFASEPVQRLDRGDAYALSRLVLTSHTGTHVDAPRHFFPQGAGADALDLDVLNGRCVVLAVRAEGRTIPGEAVDPVPAGTMRVLLRTTNSDRWATGAPFFGDYVGLGLGAARRLADRGVRLVGIDSLSVETEAAGAYPVHRELLGRGVVVLEGLLLAGAPPGAYELRCLPLRLLGGDGAPARAVLEAP